MKAKFNTHRVGIQLNTNLSTFLVFYSLIITTIMTNLTNLYIQDYHLTQGQNFIASAITSSILFILLFAWTNRNNKKITMISHLSINPENSRFQLSISTGMQGTCYQITPSYISFDRENLAIGIDDHFIYDLKEHRNGKEIFETLHRQLTPTPQKTS